jgi:hypothetical protein
MSTPQSLDAGSFVGSLDELRTLVGQEVFVTDWVLLTQRHIDCLPRPVATFSGSMWTWPAPTKSLPTATP